MKDEKYCERIYEKYKNLVFNVSLKYLLNYEDARDVTQEIFVKVYHNLPFYNASKASVKTWINRITINQWLDFIQAKKTKKRRGFFGLLFNSNSEPIDEAIELNHPAIATENKEELNNLLQIINTLPANQKTAIILSKIEDRSQKEVADIMNTSVKAIESLLQRAKATIAKKLTDLEGL